MLLFGKCLIMNLIIFDGMSGSGKSTLKKEIIKKLNYNVLTIDRFTPSIWVYDFLRGINRTREIVEFENKFDKLDPLLVITYCSPEIAFKRDYEKEAVFGYEKEKLAFDKYLNNICRYKRGCAINTEVNSIEESIKIIEVELEGNYLHLR